MTVSVSVCLSVCLSVFCLSVSKSKLLYYRQNKYTNNYSVTQLSNEIKIHAKFNNIFSSIALLRKQFLKSTQPHSQVKAWQLTPNFPTSTHLLFTDSQFTEDDGLDQLAHQNQDAVHSVHHRLKNQWKMKQCSIQMTSHVSHHEMMFLK